MMGLHCNRDLFTAMEFRVGHAIKLASILQSFLKKKILVGVKITEDIQIQALKT